MPTACACACLAQLVNVIAPIRTEPGGPAWRQTIFHPFADVARLAHGTVLDVALDGPAYTIEGGDRVPALEAVAVSRCRVCSADALRRQPRRAPVVLEADCLGFDRLVVEEHRVLGQRDLGLTNTATHPDRVAPSERHGATMDGPHLTVELPPSSWNVVRLST